MRRAIRFISLSLLGVVTTVATYMVGLIVMPATALSADVRPAAMTSAHNRTALGCVLPVSAAALSAPILPMTQQRSAARRGNGDGDLVAAIPGAVFIRPVGRDLVVTTNTGHSPQRGDTFYYIRDHHAGLADAAVTRLVRFGCARRESR